MVLEWCLTSSMSHAEIEERTHTPSNRKHYFSTTHVRERGVGIFSKLEIRDRSLIWPAHFFRVMTSGAFQPVFDGKDGLGGLENKGVSHISGTIFHLLKSDFRSDESFPVKAGTWPTEMVDEKCQLPVLSAKNRSKTGSWPKRAQKKGNSRLSNQNIRNHMLSSWTSGFIAVNPNWAVILSLDFRCLKFWMIQP